MNNLIKDDEQICDLQCEGLVCFQKKKGYGFTTDAVLLANFVRDIKDNEIAEFCAGSGVISMLVNAKCKPKHIFAVEIQPSLTDMCGRSLRYNKIYNIEPVCADFKDFAKGPGNKFDAIISNPPYFKLASGRLPQSQEVKMAKYETNMTLSELVKSSAGVLKDGGKLFLVYPTQRLNELEGELAQNGFKVKRKCYCFPKQSKPSNIFLVEAIKTQAGVQPTIEPPIVLNNEDGTETEQLKMIYNRNNYLGLYNSAE
ncbi:MAG: methyltransferase [Clostridia bacterium]|nr:methyltransferase [Clostridia bacterium]